MIVYLDVPVIFDCIAREWPESLRDPGFYLDDIEQIFLLDRQPFKTCQFSLQ
jgi:hypothetical protein